MSQDGYPDDLLYHPEHDWARIDPEGSDQAHPEATLGITWYAQDALGEVVFFEAPAVGTLLVQGAPYAEVESVKAVSDVVAPLSGEIVAVNETLADSPQLINEDPYGEGWMFEVETDPATLAQELAALMDADGYGALAGT